MTKILKLKDQDDALYVEHKRKQPPIFLLIAHFLSKFRKNTVGAWL